VTKTKSPYYDIVSKYITDHIEKSPKLLFDAYLSYTRYFQGAPNTAAASSFFLNASTNSTQNQPPLQHNIGKLPDTTQGQPIATIQPFGPNALLPPSAQNFKTKEQLRDPSQPVVPGLATDAGAPLVPIWIDPPETVKIPDLSGFEQGAKMTVPQGWYVVNNTAQGFGPVPLFSRKIANIPDLEALIFQNISFNPNTHPKMFDEGITLDSIVTRISDKADSILGASQEPNDEEAEFLKAFGLGASLSDKNKYKGESSPMGPSRNRAKSRSAPQEEEEKILSEQAVLLFHLPELMLRNKEKRKGNIYRRISCLDVKGPTMPDLANLVSSRNDMSHLFEDLRPVHLSAIIPRVRVYKPIMQQPPESSTENQGKRPKEGESTTATPTTATVREELKTTMVEYHFEQFPVLPSSPEKLTLGTSTGVGLMSFGWDILGNQNEFASKKHIRAKMRLRAQTIDDLLKKRESGGISYRFTDIFFPEITKEQLADANKEGAVFAVPSQLQSQVVMDYSIDLKNQVWKGPAGKDLAESIKSLKATLRLTNTTFSLSMNDDGSLFVDLDFMGHHDAASSDVYDANILPSEKSQRFMREMKKLALDRAAGIEQLEDLRKRRHYAGLIRKGQPPPAGQTNTEQLQVDITDQGYMELDKQVQRQIEKLDPHLTGAEYERRYTTKYIKRKLYTNVVGSLLQKNKMKAIRVNPCDITTAPDFVDDYNTAFSGSTPCPFFQEESYTIPYFYYGDLLNTVLESKAGEGFQGIDTRIVLGPMTIVANASQSTTAQAGALKTKGAPKISINDIHKMVDCPDHSNQKADAPTKIKEESEELLKEDIAAEKIQYPDLDEYGLTPETDGYPTDPNGPSGIVERQSGPGGKWGDSVVPLGSLESVPPPEPEKEQEKEESYIVNIADIPISFRLFQSWWSEKIINTGKATMPLKRFISDSINSLIISALEAEATSMILPTQVKDLITVPFSANAPADPGEADAFRFLSTGEIIQRNPFAPPTSPAGDDASGLLFLEDLRLGPSPLFPLPQNKHQKVSNDHLKQSYFFIFCRENNPTRTYRLGSLKEYRRDLQDGIYHLRSGKDAGLVKDIKMSVVTWDEFERTKVLEAIDAQKKGPIYRKRIYNAEVTLFGAPFLRPTQIVYINPAAHGSREVLRDMGLSGYYMITSVRNHFEGGKFETTLSCAFQYDGAPPEKVIADG